MPLRDHFHPPLSELRHWESFHSRWAGTIADHLDGHILPEGYFAEVQVHVGNRVEVDIATFEDHSRALGTPRPDPIETAVPPASVWAPPVPTMKLPAYFPDRVEVLIFHSEAGPTLVSAIELVSPRNKDRPQSRRDFAIKCANYLRQGLGLLVVDIVTNRRSNLHNELMALLDQPTEFRMVDTPLYAVSYQPVQFAKSTFGIRPFRSASLSPRCPCPWTKAKLCLWIWKRPTNKRAGG